MSTTIHIPVGLICIMLVGCQKKGFDLQLHMPVEVSRIELKVDYDDGVAPVGVGNNTYAIYLDEQGKATIDGDWPIARWHRTFIVLPNETLQKNYDFRIVDSGWIMTRTVTRTPQGVTSKTKIDGSTFFMEIERIPPNSPPNPSDASR